MLNITSQWQEPEILIFCYKSTYITKNSVTLVPKFRSDLSFSLSDIAEKQVPVKLKPMVG